RAELDVHLDADDRVEPAHGLVVVHQRAHRAISSSFGARSRSGPPHESVRARSNAPPTRYIRWSLRAGAMICRPTGRPSSDRPDGSDMAGTPARFAGMVATSLRYIAS